VVPAKPGARPSGIWPLRLNKKDLAPLDARSLVLQCSKSPAYGQVWFDASALSAAVASRTAVVTHT
jgi:hypothetical protein